MKARAVYGCRDSHISGSDLFRLCMAVVIHTILVQAVYGCRDSHNSGSDLGRLGFLEKISLQT